LHDHAQREDCNRSCRIHLRVTAKREGLQYVEDTNHVQEWPSWISFIALNFDGFSSNSSEFHLAAILTWVFHKENGLPISGQLSVWEQMHHLIRTQTVTMSRSHRFQVCQFLLNCRFNASPGQSINSTLQRLPSFRASPTKHFNSITRKGENSWPIDICLLNSSAPWHFGWSCRGATDKARRRTLSLELFQMAPTRVIRWMR
jgi:hypothetical protein